jgi:hypothetical protein
MSNPEIEKEPRDSELAKLSIYEFVDCVVECARSSTSDLERLNREARARKMIINTNGIMFGLEKGGSDGRTINE